MHTGTWLASAGQMREWVEGGGWMDSVGAEGSGGSFEIVLMLQA